MRMISKALLGALVLSVPMTMAACSSDDDGKGDNTGGSNGDGDGTGGGNSGTGGNDGSGGSSVGGAGGDGPGPIPTAPPFGYADCEATSGPTTAVKKSGIGAFSEDSVWLDGWTNWSINSTPEDTGADATVTLSGELTTQTLDKDTVYALDGNVYVPSGVTLTIPAGTLIKSEGKATLIVSRGGKLVAKGTKEAPIVFTSNADNGKKAAQQWGGIVLLGRGQNFKGKNTTVEGIEASEGLINVGYGCDAAASADDLSNDAAPIFKCDENDSSGELSYVRIEFGGVDLAVDNEINGLTLGSVGAGTVLHHVQVNTNFDDCIEWFGGNVNGDHLVCNNAGDDAFDMDQGYVGTVEYLFSRQVAPAKPDPNGFEWDSDLGDKTPVSNPTVKHATICGIPGKPNFGAVWRENITATVDDVAFIGFDATFDTRDDFTKNSIKLTNSYSWDMVDGLSLDESVACADGKKTACDNDMGFDEAKWFEDEATNTNWD